MKAERFGKERRHRKERLAAACRVFALFGFDEGASGHITVRDPEKKDHFWVNPFGLHFSQIRVSDLLMVDEDGKVVEGERPLNRAAFAIHSRVHKARPDIMAAAWWFVKMDRCCQSQLLLEAIGDRPVLIDEEQAEETRKQVGSEKTGWFHFQPLWNRIVREQPEFLT